MGQPQMQTLLDVMEKEGDFARVIAMTPGIAIDQAREQSLRVFCSCSLEQ